MKSFGILAILASLGLALAVPTCPEGGAAAGVYGVFLSVRLPSVEAKANSTLGSGVNGKETGVSAIARSDDDFCVSNTHDNLGRIGFSSCLDTDFP
ncbi:hypothetical protein BDV26DRAFT_292183 [Aspergillus bertholletiae]|uniref:Uncharacterized protein n=1 Tax=Aspergillus bertholletiae TaxID=1226010 RepID=A0A5N7B9T1_9EURO|nr:hypothetical protein BDV26DRAFT_292183 [Aspergillus bertholletiae]